MTISLRKSGSAILTAITILVGLSLTGRPATAQNPELQQRLAEVKEASARNKEALATYTWREQDTISLKGEVKKQESFQVHMGPDGKPQKAPLNAAAAAQPSQAHAGGRGGRLKEKVIENKKEEYKEYGQKMAALAHSYVPPDRAKLQQAFQEGNVKLGAGATAGLVQLLIINYVKPNDSMTITFDKATKAIQGVQIASYLDAPSDVVNRGAIREASRRDQPYRNHGGGRRKQAAQGRRGKLQL